MYITRVITEGVKINGSSLTFAGDCEFRPRFSQYVFNEGKDLESDWEEMEGYVELHGGLLTSAFRNYRDFAQGCYLFRVE